MVEKSGAEAAPEGGSVARVRAALAAAGHPDTIRIFPEGTRTAEDAARAVGCDVAAIAKSLVFRTKGSARPVLVIASGADRIDLARVAEEAGGVIERAEGRWVREVTGFAIDGVSPIGHLTPPVVLVDAAVLRLDRVWAAAGSPAHVFETTPERLLALSAGRVADVAERAA
ncbi:YbaK/EbsC family protein [Elioraea sp.]|uniref:YbaK/EbsC family protein n=1 Tax=Elioraea sp. TaxID=2185103 RepID=UPI0025B8C45C|nr:YbaK/EbsC family protein [Elioraea sp.]